MLNEYTKIGNQGTGNRIKEIIAWVAVIITAIFSNTWAYWGIIENFHEGWYYTHLGENVAMMFGQYLLMPLVFMILGFIAIRWHKAGAALCLLVVFLAYSRFGEMNAGVYLIIIPVICLALLFWFGNFTKNKIQYFLVIGLPLIIMVCVGSVLAYKVSGRYNDNNFGARLIRGNGAELIWAPAGPGWPDKGTSWHEAKYICAHLSADGVSMSDSVLNIWRLPTVDESVRSLVHHGNNAGGIWNDQAKTATYERSPDKESPLWNVHLKTIYWWTSTEVNDRQAYIIVYNGGVYPRMKKLKAGYLNFRAVKNAGLSKEGYHE